MVLVKFEAPNEECVDLWINKDRIEIVRQVAEAEQEDFPGCSWVFLIGDDEPLVVKGSVEAVLRAIGNS